MVKGLDTAPLSFHGAAYGVDQTAYRVQSKGVDSLFGAISHLGTERQKGTDLQSTLDKQMLCKQLMQAGQRKRQQEQTWES
ncbi:unnamed protein product [Symbiodinium sp. KB8]|nr:unnamed protein product [Symbiodinium sp. KB8]